MFRVCWKNIISYSTDHCDKIQQVGLTKRRQNYIVVLHNYMNTIMYTGVTMTMRISLLLLCLLWSLVEVHSQTPPYVSFMGETLPNHAYVDLSLVGSSGSDSVQCHTDLSTCCTGTQGVHRGDWYPPDSEMRLPFSRDGADIYEVRGDQRVDLRHRNNADMPSGIYHCHIALKLSMMIIL